MGINTGLVTAGNMGSDRKFQYTVMGDAVNLAARLEPLNKDYGTSIVIGEATWQKARDAVEVRLLDKVIVKGKTKPIQVYELLAAKGGLLGVRKEVVHLYEEALRLHWDRKWDEAIRCVERALEMDPRDAPGIRLREVARSFRTKPPPDSWTGEFVRSTKD
jgi:adenylate cyclase